MTTSSERLEDCIWGNSPDEIPPDVCPILFAFFRGLSADFRTYEDFKSALGVFIPRLSSTRQDVDATHARAWSVVDWSVRAYLCQWVEFAGLKGESAQLRDLPPVRDAVHLGVVKELLNSINSQLPLPWNVREEGGPRIAGWGAVRESGWHAIKQACKLTKQDGFVLEVHNLAWAAAWTVAKKQGRDSVRPIARQIHESVVAQLDSMLPGSTIHSTP